MPGIFISRGMTIRIPAGGLRLTLNGDAGTGNDLVLHVRFDVCPTWTEIAMQHLADARERRTLREIAWRGTDEPAKGAALEREFESSMQAIMAAATALEAFYSVLQTEVSMPPSLVEKWRTKRTARYSQVTEVIRRAYAVKPKGVTAIRGNLKEVYRMRDLAVHPSGKIEAPVLHPELDVGVEWRFAYFRASNAELVVNAVSWLLWELSHRGKPTTKPIADYTAALKTRLQEVFPKGHPFETLAPTA